MAVTATPFAAVLELFDVHGAQVTPWDRHGSTSAALVTRPDEPDLVLTSGSLAGTADQLRQRAAIVDHLAGQGLPVGAPVRTGAGDPFAVVDGAVYMLAPRLTPPTGADGVPTLAGWRTVGAQLAALHSALATAPPGLESWHVDLAARLRGDEAVVVRARKNGTVPANTGTAIDVDAILRRLPPLPEQRLHGDCHGGNLLLCAEGLYGIVDLDHLPVGPRVYDLGYYCADLVKNRQYFPDEIVSVVGSVVSGYHAASPLSSAEADAVVACMVVTEFQFVRFFLEDRVDAAHLASHLDTMRAIEGRLDDLERIVAEATAPGSEGSS